MEGWCSKLGSLPWCQMFADSSASLFFLYCAFGIPSSLRYQRARSLSLLHSHLANWGVRNSSFSYGDVPAREIKVPRATHLPQTTLDTMPKLRVVGLWVSSSQRILSSVKAGRSLALTSDSDTFKVCGFEQGTWTYRDSLSNVQDRNINIHHPGLLSKPNGIASITQSAHSLRGLLSLRRLPEGIRRDRLTKSPFQVTRAGGSGGSSRQCSTTHRKTVWWKF